MKHIIYWAALILTLLAGCTKASPGTDAPAPERYDRYIFFSQSVPTKAALIESVNGSDMGQFGVVGFKYDIGTTWSAVKANATPNVFYDEDPDAAGTYSLTDVETVSVSVDGTNNSVGTGSYAPLQGWSNSKKYAFFAYFPLDNSTVSLVNTDGSDYTGGVPAIRYTMDPTSGETFRNSMVDVMTAAAHKDQYWKSSTDNTAPDGEIGFDFSHRLSSLGLKVKNSTAGGITVNSVSFNISGLKNQSIILPLDGGTAVYGNEGIDAIACSLTIPEGGTAITTSDTEISDKLILIPQTDPVTLTVTVGYTRTLDGYADNVTSHTTYELSTALNEGKKHIVNLNFRDSTVDVELRFSPWTASHTIDNTFN